MKIQGWISYDGKNERIRISVKIDEYRHKTKFLEVIFLYKEVSHCYYVAVFKMF